MITNETLAEFEKTLTEIRDAGLFKQERSLQSSQGPRVTIEGREYLNLCTNDYLGLAAHPDVVAAARTALDRDGFGMASVRFISGTHEEHRGIEAELSSWLGTDDTILFPSCFDANGGVFETLLDAEDAVISDELNHASIIDGVRLSKAQRYRYKNRDMTDLDAQLTAARAAGARRILVVTDGVFSMDGYLAPLGELCDVAERHDALVMVDDSHAVGILGQTGAGTPELFGVRDRVDLVTGTLGKALGGASGGYVSGRGPLIELLRQRARPPGRQRRAVPLADDRRGVRPAAGRARHRAGDDPGCRARPGDRGPARRARGVRARVRISRGADGQVAAAGAALGGAHARRHGCRSCGVQ